MGLMRAFDFVDNIRPTQPVMVGELVFQGRGTSFSSGIRTEESSSSGLFVSTSWGSFNHQTFSGIAWLIRLITSYSAIL